MIAHLALAFALGILAAVAFIAFLFATAPEAYEDETGFHHGKPPPETSRPHGSVRFGMGRAGAHHGEHK